MTPEPEIKPGRDRLRGMGAPSPAVAAEAQPASPATSPKRRTPKRRRPLASAPGPEVGDAPPEARQASPYAGERKLQVNPRVFPSLWARYEQLVHEVRASDGRATLTDAVNAVLHFNAPADAPELQELLNRYRSMLAVDPPGQL